MFNEFTFGINAAAAMKRNYDKLSDGIKSKPGTNLWAFHQLVKTVAQATNNNREQLKKDIQKFKDTDATPIANKKTIEAQREFDAKVNSDVAFLKRKLDEIIEAKRANTESFMMASPSDEQLRKLQLIQMRGISNFSDRELELIAGEMGTNYLAAQTLKTWADAAGKTMILPFDNDRTDQYFEGFVNRARAAIDSLIHPEKYDGNGNVFDFLSDNEESITNQLVRELDGDAFTKVPDNTTIRERLEEAQKRAEGKELYKLSGRIKGFMAMHDADFTSKEELQQRIIDEAESLILKSYAEDKEEADV